MEQQEKPTRSTIILNRVDYEAGFVILREAVLKLWDVVDDLTKLRPRKTNFYNVTIFGSSRIAPGTPQYDEIKRLATELAAMGCHIVTGGGPGLMQAANEGALIGAPDHPERSIGIRVDLEFEQATNAFVGQVYEHKTFFSRLHHFVSRSNAFVVVPGGIGTTLEMMLVWQLLQVRKLYDTPFVLVGRMWPELIAWARIHMVEAGPGLADPIDMAIPLCVEKVEDAVAVIRDYYLRWEQQPEYE